MKVKLLKDARVTALKGEVVNTSPECAKFLVSSGQAEYAEEKAQKPREESIEEKAEPAKKSTKKK